MDGVERTEGMANERFGADDSTISGDPAKFFT
jgi:hypothetical protein